MLKRWREKRKLLELAKLLAELDEYAAAPLGRDGQRRGLREERLEALRLEQAAPDAAREVELVEDLLCDGVSLLRAPLLAQPARQLLVAVVRVEDAPDDELRRDGSVPAVLLEAEDDVVPARRGAAGRDASPARTRSRCRSRGRPRRARGTSGACRRRRCRGRAARTTARARSRRDCRARTARAVRAPPQARASAAGRAARSRRRE